MKNIEIKVIRGDYKDTEMQLNKLLNKGFRIHRSIVIDNDNYLYVVLIKRGE